MEDIGYTNITFNIWKDFSLIFGVGFIESNIKNISGEVILQTSVTGDFLLKIELFSSEREGEVFHKHEILNGIFSIGEVTYDDNSIYVTYPISKSRFRNNLTLAKNEALGLKTLIELGPKAERRHLDMNVLQKMVDEKAGEE